MISKLEKLKTKRTFYMLCFVALMLIDWTRGSQIGVVWAWTINMTGVVIAAIIASTARHHEFRHPVYLIYTALCLAALPASYLWWMGHQAVIYRDQMLSVVVNVWAIGIVVIMWWRQGRFQSTAFLSGTVKQLRIWQLLGALMLLWMTFSRNEDIWPLYYLILFGLLYHADFTDADRKALRDGALDGIILSFFLLQGAAFVFRPYDDPTGRYCGIYGNANMNALFYCIVFVAFLCRLHLSRKTNEAKWKKIFYFLFAGALVGFVMLTISKTAMIAVFAVLICYVILSDLKQLREKAGRVVLQMVLMSLLILFCIPITYAAARYIPPLFHHPIWYDGEYSEERVHGWDSWDSDKYISFDRMTNELSDRILPYLEKMGLTLTSHAAEPVVTQTETATTSAPTWDHRYDSSNGRIMIWKHYLAGGNLTGHSSTEGHQIDANWSAWHAQNMFIQFWYYYGIPSAVLFAICAIWMLFMALRRAWRDDSSIALMVSLYYLLFLLYGLFEATWYPGQMILLLAFFMPAFLMGGRQD